MTFAHWVLLILSMLCAGEAIWAITRTNRFREQVRTLLDESLETGGNPMVYFGGGALLVWLVAAFGGSWAHRTLFFIGVLLMGLAFLSTRNGFTEAWYGFWLEKRSNTAVRAIYTMELILAAAGAWLAIRGQ